MLSILIHIFCAATIMVLLFCYLKQRKDWSSYTETKYKDLTDQAIEEKLKQAFQLLQLNYSKDKEKDKECTLHVDYQNAHFILNYKNASTQGIDIIYPFFYKERIDYIDTIRAFCNRINTYHSPMVVSYINDEDYMYINASTNISGLLSIKQIAEEFTWRAASFFNTQREITATLFEDIRNVKKLGLLDYEYNKSCDNKMKQLVMDLTVHAEQNEFILPDEFLETRNTLTISELLQGLHYLDSRLLTRMEVIAGHNMFSCDMPEKIRSYKVCTPLLGSEHPAEDLKEFVHQEAVVRLYYTQSSGETSQNATDEHVLYLMLKAAEATPQTLFFQATLCQPEKKLANSDLKSLHESLHGQTSTTLLLGYELVTPNQQKAEFDFMYKDIEDKIAEGHSDKLTPEQLFIYGLSNPNAAFFAYWGKRYVRYGRYVEAIVRLNQAWNLLNNDFDSLSKSDKKTFYDVSALIGLCLYKLDMPQTALYYYHLASEIENTYYFCMTIRCMIASNDPLCLDYIDHSLNETINQIAELKKNEGSLPEMLPRLYQFLRRAKVQMCFRRKLYYEAEELCLKMSQENENADFALTYLKLIQQIRNRKA